MNSYQALLSVFSSDRVGLISEVTSHLFNQGVNLGDTSFAILGKGGEFSSIIEVPSHLSETELTEELSSLEGLKGADIAVKRISLPDVQAPSTEVTHNIQCEGRDQPGLLARLSEVFTDFGGNIVRLKSDHVEAEEGWHFITRLSVNIPASRADNCLAALGNTAAELGQKLVSEKIS